MDILFFKFFISMATALEGPVSCKIGNREKRKDPCFSQLLALMLLDRLRYIAANDKNVFHRYYTPEHCFHLIYSQISQVSVFDLYAMFPAFVLPGNRIGPWPPNV